MSPAATCLYLFQRWLVVESFAKQRQQQPHHQLTDDSTNVTTFQVQRTWTYFTYLQYFCRAEATSRSSFPMKTEQVFGHSLAICTVVNIDSQGTRNGESPYSPNLKSDFPEFLGNAWGMPGEFLGNAQPSCHPSPSHCCRPIVVVAVTSLPSHCHCCHHQCHCCCCCCRRRQTSSTSPSPCCHCCRHPCRWHHCHCCHLCLRRC